MKLKGINPFEQHVEKIVLVAVSAVFLVVVAAQFLIEPNRVKVGGGQPVAPGKAFADSASRAARLKAMMESPPPIENVAIPEVRLAQDFRDRLTRPVTPSPRLAVALGSGTRLQAVDETRPDAGAVAVAVPAVPAPGEVSVRAYRNTLDPLEPIRIPGLAGLVPAEQPLDKASVSVEARFDGQDLQTALSSASGARAMPQLWWGGDRTAVLAVRLEREELVDGENWTNTAEVPPAPGGVDGLARVRSASGQMDMADAVAELRAAEADILRPEFYRVIAGQPWAPPSEGAAAPVGPPRAVTTLVQGIKQARRSQDSLRKQIEGLGGGRTTPPPPTGGGGKGGAGGGGGTGGGQPTRDPTAEQRNRLQTQIDNLQKRIDGDIEKLRQQGYDEEGQQVRTEPEPGASPTREPMRGAPLFSDSAIRLWAHDLTAAPGKTYRYRVKLAINNPAFGRGAALPPEQQDFARQPVIWSRASGWSGPVTVPADRYYFITSTSESSSLGPAHATAEVYQFFYGYYRKGTVGLEPGDPIVAAVKLPDAAKLPIYDLTKVPGDGTLPQAPGAAPQPQVTPGGGGKGGAAGAPGEGSRGAAPQPAQPQAQLPANARPWTTPIVAAEDVFLLDVQQLPASEAGSRPVAILRDSGGRLITRSPEESSDTYKAVAASAREGESQGQPAQPEPERERPRLPQAPQPATPRPVPGGGGGGGGGGGS
jgi:hypothetical protein